MKYDSSKSAFNRFNHAVDPAERIRQKRMPNQFEMIHEVIAQNFWNL